MQESASHRADPDASAPSQIDAALELTAQAARARPTRNIFTSDLLACVALAFPMSLGHSTLRQARAHLRISQIKMPGSVRALKRWLVLVALLRLLSGTLYLDC